MTIIYDKIAIIGVGLIGASIALAARRAGLPPALPAARSIPPRQVKSKSWGLSIM